MRKIKPQYGIGLLEILLAVTIITILLTMAARYYRTVSIANKVNESAEILQGMINAAEDFKVSKGSYGDSTECITGYAYLAAFGLLPTPSSPSDPWGGTPNVVTKGYSGSCSGVGSAQIMISLGNGATIDRAVCHMIDGIMRSKGACPEVNTCGSSYSNYQAYYPASAGCG